ncbi:MAG: hypothetical protein KDB74_09465 [Flavobacteriales bacterium]|nr:hypothetical protein [Flavobacteriales bacterium]
MFQKQNLNYFFLFLVLGFLLYGNTLNHEFTLDDAIVITENQFTKKGFDGIYEQLSNDQFVGFYGVKKELVSGGRYRPLSMVVFNVQYALAGESAFIGHLCNVLAYILCGFLLFLLLQKLLMQYKSPIASVSFALLASLLWFFHPIHTEVVANIKGLDEMMAFIGELLALAFVLKYLEQKKTLHLILAFIIFFLALLSKENAITWLVVIPLTVYFFTEHSFKKALPAYLSLFAASLLWFYIRYQVVGGGISDVADSLMNDPFLDSSTSEKYATIVLTLGKYLQLLVFPHPLTYDYYPKHIPIVNWSNSLVILTILTYIFLAFVAIKGFLKKNLFSYSIFFFVITLSIASNLIFPIGAFMNERFVFVSSVGFSLVLAYGIYFGLPKLFKSQKASTQAIYLVLAVIGILYSTKTITRNLVWKNNYTLSTHDANISVNGAKSNVMAGGVILEEKVPLAKSPAEKAELLEQSIFYLNRAITVYPEYIDALILMGNAQWEKTKSAKNVMPYYYSILQINPYHGNTLKNSAIVLEQEKDIDYRIQAYQTLLKYNSNEMVFYLNLGRTYGQYKNDLQKAMQYIETAERIAPNNYDVLRNLGIVYGLSQQFSKSIVVLEKAIQQKPNIALNYVDLAVSYYNLGEIEKAKSIMNQAVKIDSTIDRSKYPI